MLLFPLPWSPDGDGEGPDEDEGPDEEGPNRDTEFMNGHGVVCVRVCVPGDCGAAEGCCSSGVTGWRQMGHVYIKDRSVWLRGMTDGGSLRRAPLATY